MVKRVNSLSIKALGGLGIGVKAVLARRTGAHTDSAVKLVDRISEQDAWLALGKLFAMSKKTRQVCV
jgi:hypothetical protein